MRGGRLAGWSIRPLRALLLMAAWAAAEPAKGQQAGRLTGIVAGRAESEQAWSLPVETRTRSGMVVGAFLEGSTPLRWLRVRAEAGYVQRGGHVDTDIRGNALDGQVQSDYLTFRVEGKLGASVGPLHVYAAAGPGVDYLTRSRKDAVLAQVLVEGHPTVLTAGAALGAGVRAGRVVVEAEGRLVRGLTAAHSGPEASVTGRSTEVMVRVSWAGG